MRLLAAAAAAAAGLVLSVAHVQGVKRQRQEAAAARKAQKLEA